MDVILILLAIVALVAGLLTLFRSGGTEPLGWGVTALALIHLIPLI